MLAMQLEEFVGDCGLEIDAFLAKHGRGFLLHCALDRPPDLKDEVEDEPSTRSKKTRFTARLDPEVLPMSFGSQYSVYRLRTSPGSSEHIKVGRVDENEVCIADSSISKQHAEVRQVESDQFAIMDLGSKNGTMVEQERLLVRVWQSLESNATVQLGEVKLTFMLGPQFVAFVKQTCAPR